MVIVQLPDDLYSYLQLVIKRYASGGIEPEEGQALFFLNDFVKKAQHIPDAEVQAAARVHRPTDDLTSGQNSGIPAPTNVDELNAGLRLQEEANEAPVSLRPEPLNDGVRSLKRGDVDH